MKPATVSCLRAICTQLLHQLFRGLPGGSAGQASDSWLRLRSCSRGPWVEPCIGLLLRGRRTLAPSAPLPFHTLSLSEKKKDIQKLLKNPALCRSSTCKTQAALHLHRPQGTSLGLAFSELMPCSEQQQSLTLMQSFSLCLLRPRRSVLRGPPPRPPRPGFTEPGFPLGVWPSGGCSCAPSRLPLRPLLCCFLATCTRLSRSPTVCLWLQSVGLRRLCLSDEGGPRRRQPGTREPRSRVPSHSVSPQSRPSCLAPKPTGKHTALRGTAAPSPSPTQGRPLRPASLPARRLHVSAENPHLPSAPCSHVALIRKKAKHRPHQPAYVSLPVGQQNVTQASQPHGLPLQLPKRFTRARAHRPGPRRSCGDSGATRPGPPETARLPAFLQAAAP
uniref:uncharacterized protein LOC129523405 n=1 Tax=Nyctereutes procyonoides TaxID=34880 RepID=UPI0024450B66|nr:uncharacterized protein LOC129523405 [Nyctereutes procyonoides]XP_055202288.1 uncharacterized protein LOC129523405 [Nyctereutes procyonoides]XP_055202290.1 uncharacterized protein LOC129523405 [Nyctereutes procyonoides]XP_055202291.1 uncharacterized protein LOC129523405 [Nyctereutes procyonoides]XP_055202292.1 uncharacterized protein LOC129523405 [Nyctereutes procyonoides]XP_055202293.1 uncharacterized protein LOC129523405 [Nyctereutes procyonoides]